MKLKTEVAITFLGTVGATLFGVGSAVIFARGLGTDGRGLLALAMLVPTLSGTFCRMGQDTVNATFGGLYKNQRSALFVQTLLATLVGGSISVLVIYAFYNWLPVDRGQFSRVSPMAVGLSCLIAPIMILSHSLLGLLRGVGKIKAAALLHLATGGSLFVFAVVFVLLIPSGVEGGLLANILSLLVVVPGAVYLLREYVTLRLSVLTKALMLRSVTFGFQTSLATFSGYLIYRLDQGMLGYMVSAGQLGLYAVAVGLAERGRLIPKSISVVFLSRLSNELAQRQKHTAVVFRRTLTISILSVMLMGVVGGPAILLLFGWEYIGSIIPFLVLLPGIAALGGSSILSSDLLARSKPKYAVIISYTTLLFQVLQNLVLIPHFGILGAAVSSTTSYIAALVLVSAFYIRESKVPARELLLRREDWVQTIKMGGEQLGAVLAKVGLGRRRSPKGLSSAPRTDEESG